MTALGAALPGPARADTCGPVPGFEALFPVPGSTSVPPNGKVWVDHIRNKGNEATHEIRLMAPEDAAELISFSEMLLKFVFEFPAKVPKAP